MKWGSVARRADVGDIVRELTDGSSRGVLIVGSRGAGKTWTLGRIRAVLGPEAIMIRLSASKGLATIPFGAVNARLGSNLVRGNDYYEVLNGLLEQIHESANEAKHVFLMVDNAEYLDSESAAIVLQVVMSSPAKLVLVDRPGGHNTYLRELWRDGHLTRFELAPLKSEDVQRFLTEFLGGKVSAATADYLAKRSGGNPLVLQGLVTGAQDEGSLRQMERTWVLDHPGDILGTESWEFLQMDLEHVHADAKKAIELLALGGKIPLDVLLDLSSAEAVDELQQRELVEIVPGTTLTMRLARPVMAPAIRAKIPLGRSRQYLSDIAARLSLDVLEDSESVINITRWSLDCGLPVSVEQVLAATIAANQLMRPLDALQISNAKSFLANSPSLMAERAIAKMNQNFGVEARALALQAMDLAKTAEDGARALRAIHLSWFGELEYPVRIEAALTLFESRFGLVVLEDSSTRADLDVLIVRAMVAVSNGEVDQSTRLIVALLLHPGLVDAGDRVLLKSLHSEILSATGQHSKAVALSGEVIAELEHPAGFPRPDIAILAYTRSVAALIYDGAWDHVSAALQPATFVNPDLMLSSGGLRDLAWAMMACRRGHIAEVLSYAEHAAGALVDYDPWSVLPTALGIQAYGLVMRGDIPGAQACLAELAELTQRSGKFYELEGAAYAAAAQCLGGQNELGRARLRAIQRECAAKGYYGIEMTVLALLMRIGDSDSVARLGEVAELIESTGKEFFVNWARAMRVQDPVLLEQASELAMEFGYDLFAVELASNAQRKFHDRGKDHSSRKTASKVVAMREKMPGLASPVFQAIDQPKMTRREHQIALLIAQGESNNSIAARLNVSLRTIEGHLYRTFIKLDIQSREQLAVLMNGESARDESSMSYS